MEEKRKHKRLDLDVEIQLEFPEVVLVLPARRNLRPALIMTQRFRSGLRKL